MRNFFLSLFGLCCISACNQVAKTSAGTIVVVDSLKTHIDRNTFFDLTTLSNNAGKDSVLQLFNYNEKYFLIYDIISKQLLDSINIKAFTQDRYSTAGRTANGVVYILESLEKLLKRIDLKTQKIDSFLYIDESCYSLTATENSLTVLDDSIIFLQKNVRGGLTDASYRLAYFKSRPIAKMVMRDRKLVILGSYCPFPESYVDGNFKDDDAVIYARRPDELWYAFSDASRIYHTKNKKDEVIETGYPFIPLGKTVPDSLRSLTFIKQYQLCNMHVSRLEYLYDREHVHLYCKPPAPVLDSNGELNRYIDCDNYLLDYDLKKASLRQYFIPKGLDFRNGAAFRDRLVWANTRDDNEFLTLYTIKLQ